MVAAKGPCSQKLQVDDSLEMLWECELEISTEDFMMGGTWVCFLKKKERNPEGANTSSVAYASAPALMSVNDGVRLGRVR